MKRLISTLLIVSLLFVPSFVYAEGGKKMANTYTPFSSKGSGWTEMKTTPKKATSPNVIKNSVFMVTPDGKPATVSKDYVDKYKAMGYTANDDIYYDSGGTPRSYSGGSSTPDYQALYQAQLDATINSLQKQRDSALSGLDVEKGALVDTYYNKRNQAAGRSDIGALNFAQFMASRGVQGNAGAMPEVYRNASLQGQMGALDQQEAAGNADIETRRSDINSAYQNDVSAAKQRNEADLLAATIAQQQADQASALEQARYNTQQATANDVTAYNRLQDTKSAYANTVGQFGADYQAEINKVANDNDPSNDWQISILGAARAKKIQDQKDAEAAAAAAATKAQQQQFENDLKTKQYNLDVQKTNYDTNRPYSVGGSSGLTPLQQQNNNNNTKIAQMTNWIYSVPTNAEALSRLTQNKALILQQLQEAGYDGSTALKYWNDMYADITSQ
jgi:hypothetical protein